MGVCAQQDYLSQCSSIPGLRSSLQDRWSIWRALYWLFCWQDRSWHQGCRHWTESTFRSRRENRGCSRSCGWDGCCWFSGYFAAIILQRSRRRATWAHAPLCKPWYTNYLHRTLEYWSLHPNVAGWKYILYITSRASVRSASMITDVPKFLLSRSQDCDCRENSNCVI